MPRITNGYAIAGGILYEEVALVDGSGNALEDDSGNALTIWRRA